MSTIGVTLIADRLLSQKKKKRTGNYISGKMNPSTQNDILVYVLGFPFKISDDHSRRLCIVFHPGVYSS